MYDNKRNKYSIYDCIFLSFLSFSHQQVFSTSLELISIRRRNSDRFIITYSFDSKSTNHPCLYRKHIWLLDYFHLKTFHSVLMVVE